MAHQKKIPTLQELSGCQEEGTIKKLRRLRRFIRKYNLRLKSFHDRAFAQLQDMFAGGDLPAYYQTAS